MEQKSLNTIHGKLHLSAFFPDATGAFIKGVDSTDLESVHVQGVVVNTYHLLRHGLVAAIKEHGGIHSFMNFNKPIISDSGGFQVMSLIRKDPKLGAIRNDKIVFKHDNKKTILTPEKSIQIQLKLGSDILVCLDDCTMPGEAREEQQKSVERTIEWAKRCKKEFSSLTKSRKAKPLLFAVIQGGEDRNLRRECAESLIDIGFEGYGFGGYPVDREGRLLIDILRYTASLVPGGKPLYGLGIGKPESLIECHKLGYQIFDCVIPTRDARLGRLYVFEEGRIKNIYLQDDKHMKSADPVSRECDCLLCKNYTKAYIHHLFTQKDALAVRLATMHNLRFYTMLIDKLRA